MGVGSDHEQAAGALAGSEKPEERRAASSRVTAADWAWRRPLLLGVAEVFGRPAALQAQLGQMRSIECSNACVSTVARK